jgi:ATP-dependent Zn protease
MLTQNTVNAQEADHDDDSEDEFDPGFDDTPTDASEALPRALFENSVTLGQLDRCRTEDSICLIVEVPNAEWVVPVGRYLRMTMRSWGYECMREAPTRGRVEADLQVDKARRALAGGRRLFGVGQSPEIHLPRAMLSGADLRIALCQPDGRVVAAAIRWVTGQDPGDVPDELVAGVDYDTLLSCIRKASTAAQCIERLERAKANRNASAADDGVTGIENLEGYGADAMAWATELVGDVQAYRRGEIGFEEIPQSSRAVILEGPPGTGKTSLARSLAKSLSMPLVVTSVASWFTGSTGYLDAVLKEIDNVFTQARAVAPAVLLLDEADAIPNRSNMDGRSREYWQAMVTHILTTLDGAVSGGNDRLIIIGATNHFEALDTALTRPGRLGRRITIPLPDADALADIFRHYLGIGPDQADLQQMGRIAHGVGATGASVRGWVEAARHRAKKADREMTVEDVMTEFAPRDTRTKANIERTAIHEAGHAVFAHALGLGEVRTVSIVRTGNIGGYADIDLGDLSTPTRAVVEDGVVLGLGGRAAEEAALGEPAMGAGGSLVSDLAGATRMLAALHLSSGLGESLMFRASFDDALEALALNPRIAMAVEADLQRLYARALELARLNLPTIRAVADELLSHRQIGNARFKELLANHSPKGKARKRPLTSD